MKLPFKYISPAFSSPSLILSIENIIQYCPEKKREDHISDLISCEINKTAQICKREQYLSGRRHDYLFNSRRFVEAKSHYECDLEKIEATLLIISSGTKNLSSFASKKYNSADVEICKELARTPKDGFIWHVYVRDPSSKMPYYEPNKIIDLYNKKGYSNHSSAVLGTVKHVNNIISLIKKICPCTTHTLPTITTGHSALITRYVQF